MYLECATRSQVNTDRCNTLDWSIVGRGENGYADLAHLVGLIMRRFRIDAGCFDIVRTQFQPKFGCTTFSHMEVSLAIYTC